MLAPVEQLRGRLVYTVLIPAIVVAAGVLGYFSLESARRFADLSSESVIRSTVALVDEKVDRVESLIIQADEAVFHLVDLRSPTAFERGWPELAQRISPSIRELMVLDENLSVIGYSCRCSELEQRDFLDVFTGLILPDLALEQERTGVLRHLHYTYAGTTYLVSYRAVRFEGRRYYLVAHHDTGYLVREVFPALVGSGSSEGTRGFNVVDEDNVRIYGPPLARAGDYVVGHRFPTTLYRWRLQVAPEQATLLVQEGGSRALTEVGLIGLSLAVLLLGVGFLLYSQRQESRLNALRSEFVANVSHELKTPLSVVRMFAEMLLTGRVRDEAKRRHYLETILRESERLSALIENVLDFSAMERGKEAYQLRDGDLAELVARAIDTFRFRLEQHGVDIKVEVLGDPPKVRFDEQAMLLAVLNLLDNAVKYGGGTPIEVTVERGRRHVYVRVRDHGPGLADEHHKRVFERFYRVRGEQTVRGSGIGLALVKRIVEGHRGRAWLENAPGGGARVSFSLPIDPASLAQASGPGESSAEPIAPSEPERSSARAEGDDPLGTP